MIQALISGCINPPYYGYLLLSHNDSSDTADTRPTNY